MDKQTMLFKVLFLFYARPIRLLAFDSVYIFLFRALIPKPTALSHYSGNYNKLLAGPSQQSSGILLRQTLNFHEYCKVRHLSEDTE